MTLDYDDWKERADQLRRSNQWEAALSCYERSIELNPGDTVSKYDLIAAVQSREVCLRNLTFHLSPLLAVLTPGNARDIPVLHHIARDLANRIGPDSERALISVLDWVLELDDSAFENVVVPLQPANRPLLPVSILKLCLSELREALPGAPERTSP